MRGSSLGSYDLLSTAAAGDSTFLARRRGYGDDRLFAIRMVDQETATWAMSKVGVGWFPNLGPLVEVGREGDLWFVVADVSDRETNPFAPIVNERPRRTGWLAAVAAFAVIAIGGGAWAFVDGPLSGEGDGGETAAEVAETSAPATTSVDDAKVRPVAAPAPAAAAPELGVSKRILRARERQAAEREEAESRAAAIRAKAAARANAEPALGVEPRTKAAVPAAAAVAGPKARAVAKTHRKTTAVKKHEAKKRAVKARSAASVLGAKPAGKVGKDGARYCPRTGRLLKK